MTTKEEIKESAELDAQISVLTQEMKEAPTRTQKQRIARNLATLSNRRMIKNAKRDNQGL